MLGSALKINYSGIPFPIVSGFVHGQKAGYELDIESVMILGLACGR
jgi:hypothetical protein